MKNIILQKTRYLKALMLTMLVGFFAFEGSAQITSPLTVQPNPALIHYVDRDSVVTYDATQVAAESTVYLYYNSLNEENILGEGTFGTGQTINFTWPDASPTNYNLFLAEVSGDLNTPTEPIVSSDLTVTGTTSSSYNYNFTLGGGRQVTTTDFDLSGQTVRLDVEINGIAGPFPGALNDSLFVAYSTDGSNYTNLDTIRSNTFGFRQITLPAAAISATTSFRILQKNSGAIAEGDDTWRLDDMQLVFGNPANIESQVGLGSFEVNKYSISVTDVLDDQTVPASIGGGDIYPRDTVTVVADALGFDKADYDYVAYLEANLNGQRVTYQLDNQVVDLASPDSILIEGSVPLNIPYGQDWDFHIKAYDNSDSEARIGANFSFFESFVEVASGGTDVFTMDNTNETLESGIFLDPGGTGNYADNQFFTKTFYPSNPDEKLRFDFTAFELEGCCDWLYIYDGTSTAAPFLGQYNGNNSPGVIEASNAQGAITFRFTSDFSVTRPGWEANISSLAARADVDFVFEGGDISGNEITFNEDGARSLTTDPLSIGSATGVLSFDIKNNVSVVNPAGTEIVVEYTTDGSTYTELAEIDLNSLNNNFSTITFDQWPAGVASSSTQFRFRQKSNNGEGLNAWSLGDVFIDVNSNIVNGRFFVYDSYGPNTILAPDINLEVYDVLANGDIFPGSEITLNYEIVDGAFASGTEIDAFFNRNDALGYVYSVGNSSTLGGTLSVTIPAVVPGSYPIQLETSNGATSNPRNLQVSGLTLQVDSINGTPSVLFQGNDSYYPGSDVQVFYTLTGTPGTGANLLFNVQDGTGPEAEFVTVGTSSTFGGSISASLPDSIDYSSGNYQLVVSTGQALVAGGSNTESFGGNFADAMNAEPWTTLMGYEFGAAFTGSGIRSAVSEEFELENGADVVIQIEEDGDYTSAFEVLLQASVDGSTWIDLDTAELNNNSTYDFDLLLPTSLWSATTQFRLISNQDEAFGYNENAFDINSVNIETPNTQEFALATGTLDIVFPTLAVEDLDPNWVVGQDIAIDFNLTGPFPANTYVAAIVENSVTGDFELIGETAAVEVGEITGTLPLMTETEAGDPYNQIKLVPYIKADATTNYEQGNNIPVQVEADFLVVEGDDNPTFDPENFFLDQAGNRSVLTRDYDLSGVSTASIQFTFGDTDDDFDMNGNQNIVPRLQVSIDAGATFQEIPINDVNEEVGLLYESQTYTVEVPSEYLTAETHFRWVQPLNLGEGTNRWSVNNIDVILGGINALQTSYNTVNNIQGITLGNPSLNGYDWAQTVLNDAVFNGESFDYTWGIAEGFAPEDVDAFPAGTEFIFSLNNITDPETGEDVIIGNATTLGSFEGSVPLFVGSGNYTVNLTAVLVINEEEIFLYEDQAIGTLAVFNQVLKTSFNGDENEVYYAGNQVTVDYAFENDMTSTTNSEIGDLFYNLILDFDTKKWILAVDESFTGSFTVDMPPFVNEDVGPVDFEVIASVGGPLGAVGETLESSSIGFLDNTDDWINDEVALDGGFDLPGTTALLEDVSGRRVLTSIDFDLAAENAARLSFDLTVSDGGPLSPIDIDDVLEDQQFIFEYSTDGGATFTEIETFFTEGDEDGLVPINISRNYMLDGDIISASTRFRFRQEESRFTIFIENMQIVAANEAEIEYVSADDNGFVPSIKPQAIQITSVGAEEACLSNNITLNYEIRGKFGAENEVSVEYRDDLGNTDVIAGEPFNLVDGTGSIEISLPTVLSAGDNNRNFKFRLSAEDETFDDLGYTTNVNGTYTETNVEVVAPIDIDQDFSVDNQQLCDVQDIMVNIVGPQNYFTYQVVNAVTGDLIGDPLTYDPELEDTEINLGELTDEVRLGLQVTSASSSGTTCNTITSTVEQDLTVQPNYALFMGGASTASMVQPETTVDLCGNLLTLRASYYDSNGDQVNAGGALIEWFRDNLQTPVGGNATLTTFNRSGDYFARITDGNCIYTTESITVNVPDRPEQPTITVDGDLNSCDPENTVTLSGPEGFVNYVWFENGDQLASNSRVVTVDNAGTFQLQVSNSDLSNTCQTSNLSDPVIVNIPSNDQFRIQVANVGNTSWSTANILAANQVFDVCDEDERAVRIVDNNNTWIGTGSNVRWFKDGVEFSPGIGVSAGTSYPYIEESGVYYAEVRGEFGECVFTTPEVTFNVLEAPQDAPTITATGDLTFCDGQGSVILEGPEGFNYYQWNGVVGSGAITSNNTIEVSQSGTYTLQVGNVSNDGAISCLSPVSNSITVNSRNLPSIPFSVSVFDNACGDGPITFVLNNNVSNNVSYQLINAADDQPSGLAVTGSGNGSTYLTSDVLTERTTFYIEATYADGSGCTVSYPETRTFSASPNNVTLEVQGAQLIANYNGGATVRWYRDGVLLTNATSNSITITDAAEYSVEVEYATGCIVTASSADIAGKVLGNQDAMAMKVVSYPNPAQADVTLNVNSQYMGKHEVIITSMTGQVMMQSSFEKSSFEAEHAIDVANLEEGIYNVQIRHDGLTQNVRIIKK